MEKWKKGENRASCLDQVVILMEDDFKMQIEEIFWFVAPHSVVVGYHRF
jgi:hypothetical protein